ncbi:thiamine phosphate synthase [Bacillus marasmi]|uniref:thiamine phosphate synthase n=1 Tax=Bacillus marasmi TaxID=1926279 RepID=UPI001FE4E04D|nr:thiamine phosphate synthase [Bacillus marasmi]
MMKILAVTNDQYPVPELAKMIASIQSYVDYIHIREKSKTAGEIATLLTFLQQANVDFRKIVLNDRLDLALLFGINNVHLPGHGLPVQLVKQAFPQLTVGCSVHSLEEAQMVEQAGADYVLYGNCYETTCKPGKPANGLKLLSEIAQTLKIPVYGIGGITQENVGLVSAAGAKGIAMMSGIFAAKDPVKDARNFYDKWR